MCVQNKTAPLRGLCIPTSGEWGCARCARGHHFHWLLTTRPCARALLEERGEFSLHTDGAASQAGTRDAFSFLKNNNNNKSTNCRNSCVKRSGIVKNRSRCAARTLYLTEPWSHARAYRWKVNSRVLRHRQREKWSAQERAFRCSLITRRTFELGIKKS